jgi:superfamily II DNA or RNA helicase
MHLSYDRGTLVLDAQPAEVRVLQDLDILWDPRICAWRAPAMRHAEIVARAQEAGVRFSDAVRRPDSGLLAIFAAPVLRAYQEDALAAWEMHSRRGCVSLPTGSGKTIVAVAAIARVRAPALVLVPTRVLLGQWTDVLRSSGARDVGVYGDGSRVVRALTVCTFEGAYRSLDDFGDRFALCVVDEVHHFASGLRAEALEMCTAPWRLGLSATLPASEEGRARLKALVGPTVFELSVGDLAGTHLAPYDRVLLPVDLDPGERAAYEKAHAPFARAWRLYQRAAPGGDWAGFVRAAGRSDAGRAALEGLRRARAVLALPGAKRATLAALLSRHRDTRALVFTADNDAAYAVSRELLLPALTCDIGREERSRVLERFRAGDLRAIVSSRVLNEGLDVPEAEVGVVLGGALGSGEHAQRLGRLLRPRPGKRAILYEVVVRDTMEWKQSRRRQERLVARGSPAP